MISEFEKLSINEMMRFEDVQNKKLAVFTADAQDPQVRNFLQQFQGMCQQHSNALRSIMSQAGISAPAGQAPGQAQTGGYIPGGNPSGQGYA